MALAEYGNVGEEIGGNFRLANHVDELLVDVAVFMGRTPQCAAAGGHLVSIHDGVQSSLLVVRAVVGGKHIATVDARTSEHTIKVALVFLQSHHLALPVDERVPGSKEFRHLRGASARHAVFVHVEDELFRLEV